MTTLKKKKNHCDKQTDTWERSKTTSVQRVDVQRGWKITAHPPPGCTSDLLTAILKPNKQRKAWHRTGLMSTSINAASEAVTASNDKTEHPQNLTSVLADSPGFYMFRWNWYGFLVRHRSAALLRTGSATHEWLLLECDFTQNEVTVVLKKQHIPLKLFRLKIEYIFFFFK